MELTLYWALTVYQSLCCVQYMLAYSFAYKLQLIFVTAISLYVLL